MRHITRRWSVDTLIFFFFFFNRVRKLPRGSRLFHVRFCAQILNLLVKAGFSDQFCYWCELKLWNILIIQRPYVSQFRRLCVNYKEGCCLMFQQGGIMSLALKFKDIFPIYVSSINLYFLYFVLNEYVCYLYLYLYILITQTLRLPIVKYLN